VVNQAAAARVRMSHGVWVGSARQTMSAKARRPVVPMAVPRASMAAASRPRLVPLRPARRFSSFSCAAIRVAVAGKIAGKARKRPPTPGPNFLAMRPVATVIRPPKRKRMAYSWGLVSFAAARFVFMRMIFIFVVGGRVPSAAEAANCPRLCRHG
jgi:hypothetical protein